MEVNRLLGIKAQASREGWASFIRTEADERALLEGHRFLPELGEHVVDFFARFLRHSKGRWSGQAFDLLDWQRDDLILPLFSWVLPDGSRRFRQAYVEVPKKNGKSQIASGVALYLLVGDSEPGAEVYSVAGDRAQASIVFNEAANMVRFSPELRSRLKVNETTKTIAFPKTTGRYQALSAEVGTKEGLNISGLIFDELHTQKNRKLWDALRYGFAARTQPLLFTITTAGSAMDTIGREQHDYAAGVLNSTIQDLSFFAYIRAAEPEDDWTDPATWHKANPSLGITITESEFAVAVAEAQASPAKEASFRRYRLNQWQSAESPWLRLSDWKECQRDFSADDLRGRDCYAGLDLAKTRDLTALVLCFPMDDGTFRLLPWFWLPEDRAQEMRGITPYEMWSRQGMLELTPGNWCDYGFVHARIKELASQFTIRSLYYDPWNADQFVQRLQEEDGLQIVGFPQTVGNFNEPCKEFERLVLSRNVHHNGHSVLSWQIGHVAVRTDANGNIRPVKPEANDHRKIDGIVAGIMAFAGASKAEDTGGPCLTVVDASPDVTHPWDLDDDDDF